MANLNTDYSSWTLWQKQVIREEYKDILPAKTAAEKSFSETVKASLAKVKRNAN